MTMLLLLLLVAVVVVVVMIFQTRGGLVRAVGRERWQLQHGRSTGQCCTVLGGLCLVGDGDLFMLRDGGHDAGGHAVMHDWHLQWRYPLHKGWPHLHIIQVFHIIHFGTRWVCLHVTG